MADVTRNAPFRKIAGQKITGNRGPAPRTGKGGTKVGEMHGSTQGMAPRDFAAYKGIAGQPIGGKSPRQGSGPRPSGGSTLPSVTKGYMAKVAAVADQKVASPTAYPRPRRDKADKDSAHKKVVDRALSRFQIAADAESDIRRASLDDLKFFSGDQWEDGIKRQRQMDGRPCLTINRLPQFVRQVTNEQRQNRPSIQVNPVDDGADVETAEIIQGLVRHIEYDSGADAAYDTAFFGAASCGFGYFRVNTDYSGPLSFEQDIKIQRIRNPFTVYYDPNSQESDYSDADWAFIVETMPKDAYKKAYPESDLTGMEDWQSIGDTNGDWIKQDACRVAEYFWRERKAKTLYLMADGTAELKETFEANVEAFAVQAGIPDEAIPEFMDRTFDALVIDKRDTEITTVMWAKINGVEVLEDGEWAGGWIPIIKVVGDELDIDGKLVLKGIVRDAKEPQRQFNYMKSASTEAIALAPKAPYVGAEGQFEGYERQWQQANVKNFPYMQYKPTAIGGQVLPPPQRNSFEPAIQAINLAMMESADDLKAVTGIYDASLGAQGNETSGKAILARQQQAQGANFHYLDNLSRALRHCGRILLDLIPKIYDTPRVIRILGEDGTPDKKMIGRQDQQVDEEMVKKYNGLYDLSVGKYDVTISTGPSYQSRRQEAVSSIIDLTKAYPQLMGVAGDILVKNMDWPGAQEIAERLRKLLPPQVQDDENGQPDLPPEVQQQVAQLMAQVQELSQANQAMQEDLKSGLSAKQMEIASREKIAAGEQRLKEAELDFKNRELAAKTEVELAKLGNTQAQAEADREAEIAAANADRQHNVAMESARMEMAQQQPPEEEPSLQ